MSRVASADVIEIRPSRGRWADPGSYDVPPVNATDLRVHAPDRHLMMVDESGTLIARCSCWWTGAPSVHGHSLGVIGHYAARDAHAADTLLSNACRCLSRAGCTLAAGPMDGNTWRSYRMVTETGSEPPFFLEPWTAEACLKQWMAAGFAPIAEYTSAMTENLAHEDARVDRASTRLARAGIAIRPLNASDAESDLRRIFALSAVSFRRNFLYADISESEFLAQTRRLLPVISPELVLLAEHTESGLLHGFLFAVPDLLLAERGLPIDTVIVKTIAVAPTVSVRGLGRVLVARAHRIAHEHGYRRAIHALMHSANGSQRVSRRYGTSTIRRYALLGKELNET